ncbi:MAG: substrate-binding domain-containing protein [Bacilli bacterium]|jgi:hypothetical protein|nr:substrate-binding domain-containing protein [Bacilli bacterium]
MKKSKLFLLLVAVSTVALASCGIVTTSSEAANNSSSAAASSSAVVTGYDASYKGKKDYESIAKQLLTDKNLSLDGLDSKKFTLTGYQQGFSTGDTAWIAGLNNMAKSGEEVLLCCGASDLVMGMTQLSADDKVQVGGVDSLTAGFAHFFETGVYKYDDGKFASMPGPMIAAILRDLEGNKLMIDNKVPYLDQGTWQAKSGEELASMIAADKAGNYVYNANVISYMMGADAATFKTMTEVNDFTAATSYRTQYGSTALVSLKKAYKIGVIRNDGTSDESVAFENYLKDLASKLNFSIEFVTTTSGDASADLAQIDTWVSQSYDAVICLSNSANYDGMKKCADAHIRYAMFAGHPYESDEKDMEADFGDYYVGSVGPTKLSEAKVGYKMGKYFVDQKNTKFAIFGGAVAFGSEMHAYRVAGMLAAMVENESGVASVLA